MKKVIAIAAFLFLLVTLCSCHKNTDNMLDPWNNLNNYWGMTKEELLQAFSSSDVPITAEPDAPEVVTLTPKKEVFGRTPEAVQFYFASMEEYTGDSQLRLLRIQIIYRSGGSESEQQIKEQLVQAYGEPESQYVSISDGAAAGDDPIQETRFVAPPSYLWLSSQTLFTELSYENSQALQRIAAKSNSVWENQKYWERRMQLSPLVRIQFDASEENYLTKGLGYPVQFIVMEGNNACIARYLKE